MKIVNLTPREIKFLDAKNNVILKVPSSGTIRTIMARVHAGDVATANGAMIPVYYCAFDHNEGLPKSEEGTIYVVGVAAAQAAMKRKDVFVPDDAVKDKAGNLIGFRALGRI